MVDTEVQHKSILFLIKNKSGIIGNTIGSSKTRIAIRYVELITKRSSDSIKVLVLTKKILPEKFREEVRLHLPKDVIGKVTFFILTHEQILDGNINLTIQSNYYDFVLIDEAHKFCNRKTALFKAIKKLARIWCKHQSRVVPISGSVWINKEYDIWALLHIVNPVKFSSFWAFIEEYFDWETNYYGIREINNLKNRKVFLESLKDYLFIGEKEQLCPDPIVEVIERSDYDNSVYELASTIAKKKMYINKEGEIVTLKNKVSIISLLRVLSICPEDKIDGTIVNWKFEEVANAIRNDELPLCVGSVFPSIFSYLTNYLRNEFGSSIKLLQLDSNTKNYQHIIDTYKASDSHILLLSKHLSEGFDLIDTKTVISMDDHWTHKTNDQFLGRFLRRGQLRTIKVKHLKDKRLGDHLVEGVLEDKERFNQYMEYIAGNKN